MDAALYRRTQILQRHTSHYATGLSFPRRNWIPYRAELEFWSLKSLDVSEHSNIDNPEDVISGIANFVDRSRMVSRCSNQLIVLDQTNMRGCFANIPCSEAITHSATSWMNGHVLVLTLSICTLTSNRVQPQIGMDSAPAAG